jgi:hypothetical protein
MGKQTYSHERLISRLKNGLMGWPSSITGRTPLVLPMAMQRAIDGLKQRRNKHLTKKTDLFEMGQERIAT